MKVIGVLIMLLFGTAAFAGGLETVIAPPAAAQSGHAAEFSVYFHNTGKEAVSVQIPDILSCRIESGSAAVELSATALPPFPGKTVILEKGGFVKERYGFTIPAGLDGPVRMAVKELEQADVMFPVSVPAPTALPANSAGKTPTPEDNITLGSLSNLYQPYLVNFSGYEPMYFLAGTDPGKSKFQISFKYRILNPEGELTQAYPSLGGLHFGYTQTSSWDLGAESIPFKDTSYKPELFFVSPNLKSRPSWLKGLFVQTGFQHESNGRGDTESRNTNFLYLKPIFVFYDPHTRYGLQIAPKIWGYLGNDDDNNPDLKDYRGYFELDMKAGKADGFVLGSSLRWGRAGASVQLDLTYPLRPLLFHNVDFYLHAQYENALAESLLRFRERTEAVRLGFSIVR